MSTGMLTFLVLGLGLTLTVIELGTLILEIL